MRNGSDIKMKTAPSLRKAFTARYLDAYVWLTRTIASQHGRAPACRGMLRIP